ncbi:MAG: hypothetical protein OHK0038_08890 [Flammeovirgaceae bacterium]
MKSIFKLIALLIGIIGFSCEEEQVPSVAEIMANNGKSWKVILLEIDGTAVSPNLYANVRYQFFADASTGKVKPTTYQASGVGTTGISIEGDKPNYFSTTNQGDWDVAAGNVLIFDPTSEKPSQIQFIVTPKVSDKVVKIKWMIPEEIDKLIPECVMHLEKIE